MTELVGHMVTRNELGRHLQPVLGWLQTLVDVVHVHDDRSTDGTFEWLQDQDVLLSRRDVTEPSFIESEGGFRQCAWWRMEELARPDDDAWVLCIDADELLLATRPDDDAVTALRAEIEAAEDGDTDAVVFDVAEVFRMEGTIPMVRVDGFWAKISACRLVRWRYGGCFADRKEAPGSVPAGWGRQDGTSVNLGIVHVGYVRHDDRTQKYLRYRKGTGHNRQHIESILTQPLLTPWTGQALPEGIR
jgi:hypothetical protein